MKTKQRAMEKYVKNVGKADLVLCKGNDGRWAKYGPNEHDKEEFLFGGFPCGWC